MVKMMMMMMITMQLKGSAQRETTARERGTVWVPSGRPLPRVEERGSGGGRGREKKQQAHFVSLPQILLRRMQQHHLPGTLRRRRVHRGRR